MISSETQQCGRKLRELGYLILIMLTKDFLYAVLDVGFDANVINLIGYTLFGLYVVGSIRLTKFAWGFAGAGLFFGIYGIGLVVSKMKNYPKETGGYLIIACGLLLALSDVFFGVSAARVSGAVRKRWIWIWVVWFLAMAVSCAAVTYVKYSELFHSIFYLEYGVTGEPFTWVDFDRFGKMAAVYIIHWSLRLGQLILIFSSAGVLEGKEQDVPRAQETNQTME